MIEIRKTEKKSVIGIEYICLIPVNPKLSIGVRDNLKQTLINKGFEFEYEEMLIPVWEGSDSGEFYSWTEKRDLLFVKKEGVYYAWQRSTEILKSAAYYEQVEVLEQEYEINYDVVITENEYFKYEDDGQTFVIKFYKELTDYDLVILENNKKLIAVVNPNDKLFDKVKKRIFSSNYITKRMSFDKCSCDASRRIAERFNENIESIDIAKAISRNRNTVQF